MSQLDDLLGAAPVAGGAPNGMNGNARKPLNSVSTNATPASNCRNAASGVIAGRLNKPRQPRKPKDKAS
jgi:hypothetical protein